MDSSEGGDKDIDFPSLNFLNCPDIQVSQFSHLFLSHFDVAPLAANIRP